MAEPLDLDALERAVRCPCGEPGCKAEARDQTVLALIGELREARGLVVARDVEIAELKAHIGRMSRVLCDALDFIEHGRAATPGGAS